MHLSHGTNGLILGTDHALCIADAAWHIKATGINVHSWTMDHTRPCTLMLPAKPHSSACSLTLTRGPSVPDMAPGSDRPFLMGRRNRDTNGVPLHTVLP
ncbi:hypothetical protein Y1Q_0012923 [Alligator mississippiensis]|uniref:Uncharacterized protein n=1 Tax=Alligator mississippiensis TaxID=8496 RepID=A0A151P1T9_ALLMI|nr:hypothetical protein Y1Q_0012923 [Alligator mississippiensis]